MIPLRGNRVTLLNSGPEYFPAVEAAIDAARRDVRLETYIYQADAIGERIAEALKRAAGRGVAVRVMIDAFGSRLLPREFLAALEASGVRVLLFRPAPSWITLQRTRLRRLHVRPRDERAARGTAQIFLADRMTSSSRLLSR